MGLPSSVLVGMIDGPHNFYEQDVEMKKKRYYSRESRNRQVGYDCNFICTKQKKGLYTGRMH